MLSVQARATTIGDPTASDIQVTTRGPDAGVSRGLMDRLTSGATAQFIRFCVVGGVGYITNLIVFAPLVRWFHTPYLLAACIAYGCGWVVALVGHRFWTFGEREASVVGQGFRYFLVSALVLVADLIVLRVLVVAGLEPVLAQALALAIVTPLSFGLNRIWAFNAH
jgi:putative flippase GtrA